MDYSLWDTFPFPAAPEKILFIIAFAINLFHYIQHRHTTVLSANHKAVKVATLGVPAETTGKESITLLMINFVVHQVGKQTMNKTSDKKHGFQANQQHRTSNSSQFHPFVPGMHSSNIFAGNWSRRCDHLLPTEPCHLSLSVNVDQRR